MSGGDEEKGSGGAGDTNLPLSPAPLLPCAWHFIFEGITMKRWISLLALLLLAVGCSGNFVTVEATSPAFVFFYTEN